MHTAHDIRDDTPFKNVSAKVAHGYERLASVTRRAHGNSDGLIAAVLALVAETLDVGLVQLNRIDGETLSVERAHDAAGMGVRGGVSIALCESYCGTLLADAEPMMVVEDARSDSRVASLGLTARLSVGSYTGVLLYLGDGQLYGSLCTMDRTPRQPRSGEAGLLDLAGHVVVQAIEHERMVSERERVAAEAAALRQAYARMNEFMSVAGHELRTPLTSIKGNVQLAQIRLDRLMPLAEAVAPDGQTRAYPREVLVPKVELLRSLLDRAAYNVLALTRLVEDMADVSRIESGRLTLWPAPCDLTAVVRAAAEDQCRMAPDREIVLEIGQAELPIEADGQRLAQVVSNYIANALKYSMAPGRVTVGLRVERETAMVWVRDEGPGLPAEEHPRIWERFYQSPRVEARSGSSVGLGLGLHISKGIVEGHGGRVGVESVPRAGATFWFTLPLGRRDSTDGV